ncbi:ABC transporter [Parascardovia denticolens IPLA 20019]|uniref:ABC transporter ATP-binding protein n=1 Tax=Parascardovia denticolens TaxID=78258 RepID=UPI0002669E1A|nr:ATP-binding cassette domain-containing protein [Parascardovia denticolens]EIT87948.1 ABC transporter [Parascardovia denticolens IPLA 20019]
MPHGKETVLEVTGLTKQIKKTVIVDHLNFKLRKGDICGFLGENGAGKTTTLRMMAHLIFPTSGDVLIHGHSIRTDTRAALSQVGSIIENPTFYLSMTALQNLRLSAMLSDQHVPESKIAEALQKVKLENAGNQKVKTFSLGMKQRLGFANALLCDPSLIILDEPTNGLDPIGLTELKDMVQELSARGITFLISSHMLREIQDICNRIEIIHKGRQIESGYVTDLLNRYKAANVEDIYLACMGRKLA